MAYEIRWTPKAERQFAKLDKSIQSRIFAKLELAREDPFSHVTMLAGINAYKLRVGDYRILLAIEKSMLVILVLVVGHRRSVYKQ